MKSKSPANITEVLMEAVAVARRMAADPNKARALTGVAIQLMRYNPAVAKPYLMEAVIATNNATGFETEE